jgi:hypothetical protein
LLLFNLLNINNFAAFLLIFYLLNINNFAASCFFGTWHVYDLTIFISFASFYLLNINSTTNLAPILTFFLYLACAGFTLDL